MMEEPLRRLNAVCPYFTMFPIEFPLDRLRDAGPESHVLDPFCGRGTTIYAARLLALPAVGIDVNPVAVAIAQAKLAAVSAEAVVRRARRMLKDRRGYVTPPAGRFWDLAYAPSTLTDLVALREELLKSRADPVATVLRAIVMGILHGPLRKGKPTYLSNQMPRTYATKPDAAVRYWEREGLVAPEVDVLEALRRRAEYVLAETPATTRGRVLCGDVRKVLRPSRKWRFTHVITSPPYLGMRTYLPDQWLRAWFLGGAPTATYHQPGSFATEDVSRFVHALALTWRAVARCCEDGAQLVVRLGSLPSVEHDPAALLEQSISAAAAGWSRVGLASAPPLPRRSRQASQFGVPLSDASAEVDAHYVLAGRGTS
jgi:hypothetical protein